MTDGKQVVGRVDLGTAREDPFEFTFDGESLVAYPGETIAAAVLAAGRRVLRRTEKQGQPRGIFCGMGVCYDCLVTIGDRPHQRACMTRVERGMVVVTQDERAWKDGRR